MTQRKLLTDKNVRALKPAAPGKREDTYDTLIPNLLVRVTSTGHKSFCLRFKPPGKKDRVRRELGEFGQLTCDDARAKGRRWLTSLAEGVGE
jgi:Arm DNA-binding domain